MPTLATPATRTSPPGTAPHAQPFHRPRCPGSVPARAGCGAAPSATPDAHLDAGAALVARSQAGRTLPAAGRARRLAGDRHGLAGPGARTLRASGRGPLGAPAGGAARRADGRKRAAAARRAVCVDAGRLRGGLRLLHDRPRRAAAATGLGRNRGAGSPGAAPARGQQGRLHGHGRAGAQPGRRDAGHRLPGHDRRDRAQEPGLFHRRRPPRLRAPAAGSGQAGAGAVAACGGRRTARGLAAACAAHPGGRAGRGNRPLRASERLPRAGAMAGATTRQAFSSAAPPSA